MLGVGPSSVADILDIGGDGIRADGEQVGIWLGKAQFPARQAEYVMENEHLAVA